MAAMEQLIAIRQDLMIDECTVERPADLPQTPVLDADGNVVTPAPTTVYVGRCTIADPSSTLQGYRTVNDDAGVPNQRVLRVPHAADLRPGDLLTVTASAVSPGLIGDVFTVAGEDERSYATYRNYRLRGST